MKSSKKISKYKDNNITKNGTDLKNEKCKEINKSKLYNRRKKQFIEVCNRTYDKDKYSGLLEHYFAHRGAHMDYPENSIPSFEQAIKLNLGIEIDVHLTKDKKVIVFHDDNLKRMTGIDEYIRFLTLDELKSVKLNDTLYGIPTLKDTLNIVNTKVPILLEIKTEMNTKLICKNVIDELKDYKGDVFIQSFNPFVLRYFYKHAPGYLRGQLASFFVKQKLSFIKKFIIKTLRLKKFCHLDFISYNIKDLPNKYVNKTYVPVLSYSIKTEDEFKKGKRVSNNLIIDNTDLIGK